MVQDIWIGLIDHVHKMSELHSRTSFATNRTYTCNLEKLGDAEKMKQRAIPVPKNCNRRKVRSIITLEKIRIKMFPVLVRKNWFVVMKMYQIPSRLKRRRFMLCRKAYELVLKKRKVQLVIPTTMTIKLTMSRSNSKNHAVSANIGD